MSIDKSSLRSLVARAQGLGSAKEGTGHWWGMKLTSLALIPLGLWFVISVLGLLGLDQENVKLWVAQPFHAVMLLLFIGFSLHHSANGLQVVIEDYVHVPFLKMVFLITSTLAHVAGVVIASYSLLLIALKG